MTHEAGLREAVLLRFRQITLSLAFLLLGVLLIVPPFAIPAAAQTAASGVLERVDVVGNQRIEALTVQSYMTIAAGDPLDPGKVDQSLKALFATGLFADVSIRRQGNVLVVNVVENPIINRLAFEGNRRIEDDVLEPEVHLRPRIV